MSEEILMPQEVVTEQEAKADAIYLDHLYAKKLGCTQIFNEEGQRISVTVLELYAMHVTQIKTLEKDGYQALQLAFKSAKRLNKPMGGHFKSAGVEPMSQVFEVRMDGEDMSVYRLGDLISADHLGYAKTIHVTGHTIGKGFAGCIKRHNFSMQCATHGVSLSHRVPGSTGQCQFPGRVFPGKKMPGRMGNVQRTVKNLTVVRYDAERQRLLVKGAVPGSKNSQILIRIVDKNEGQL